MSKAFTREADDAPEPAAPARSSALPAGARNYLTAAGAHRLQGELERLLHVERPRLVAAGQPVRDIDQRIQSLSTDLAGAEIIDGHHHHPDGATEVRFGAAVTVRDDDRRDRRYRIVGVAEAEPRRGCISYLTPVARALLGARVGDRVVLPVRGDPGAEVEVVAIDPAPAPEPDGSPPD